MVLEQASDAQARWAAERRELKAALADVKDKFQEQQAALRACEQRVQQQQNTLSHSEARQQASLCIVMLARC